MVDTTQFDIPKFQTTSPIGEIEQASSDRLNRFGEAISGQETVGQLTGRIEDQYMLPQLREQVQGFGDLANFYGTQLRELPESVAGRTRDSLVTESQRGRIVQKEAAPLQQALTDVTTAGQQAQSALGMAQGQAQTQLQAEMAQQQKELMPFEMEFNEAQRTDAMKMTGWSTENRNELDRLLANQRAGITLSEGEKQRAHDLAFEEKKYELTLKMMEEENATLLDLAEEIGWFV